MNNTLLILQEDTQCGNFTRPRCKITPHPAPIFPALQSLVFNQPVNPQKYVNDRNMENFNSFLSRVRAWCKCGMYMQTVSKPEWIAVWRHSPLRAPLVPPDSLLASCFTRRCRMSNGQILAQRTSPLADQWICALPCWASRLRLRALMQSSVV